MNIPMSTNLTAVLLSLILTSVLKLSAASDEPRVIDLPRVVLFSEILLPSTDSQHVGEIKIPLSVMQGVTSTRLETVRLKFRGIGNQLTIIDLLPSTQQQEVLNGPISITRTTKTDLSGSVGSRGSFTYRSGSQSGSTEGKLDATVDANASHVATSELKAELLPPKVTVVSAGTTDRGQGAFFSFRQTDQNELASRREIVLLVEQKPTFTLEAFVVEYNAETQAGENLTGVLLLIVATKGGKPEIQQGIDKITQIFDKIQSLRTRMNVLLDQSDALRNEVAFPLLGYGTKRANILVAARNLEDEYQRMLSSIVSLTPSLSIAQLVAADDQLQQSTHRYDTLAKQADLLRNSVGFPYFGLGSAHARATEDMNRAKQALDGHEKAFAELLLTIGRPLESPLR